MGKKKHISSGLRNLAIVFIVIYAFLMMFASLFTRVEDSKSEQIVKPGHCEENQFYIDGKLQTMRSWEDYDYQQYCTNYYTNLADVDQSTTDRNAIRIDGTIFQNSFWGDLYRDLYNQDKGKIGMLLDSLGKIQKENNLDRNEFADMVMAFVQDIPYVLVLWSDKCDEESGDYKCVGGQRYGILSPLEFLHSLNGDCDTRTVLLYSIFKHFGYKPKIAISAVYEHAMLLLDVVSTGSFLKYKGQKYYFWETTNTGWKAGVMPPDVNNVNNWNIVLY